ncbi:MAG: chemotaxis protein CheA [Deltaproteobacteria bacterium]|nr:chemotaxis protein CheA [Deltaproteobacteria bacterium]
MKFDNLLCVINEVASEFLFLDEKVIDIPTAGKFLNQLEKIIEEAQAKKLDALKRVATGLNSILEKIILNAIDPKEGCNILEAGITTMQEIINSYENTETYEGNTEDFMKSVRVITGIEGDKDTVPDGDGEQVEEPRNVEITVENSPAEHQEKSPVMEERGEECDSVRENLQDLKEETEEKFEIQDESLLKDFIAEGLEYISEIEVNILNLEQSPEDKDYINAVFRPFHSIKGVASFLNLNDIRDIAHHLENLLDRARSGEISVSSDLIDVILDGSDILKEMIESLNEVLDGSRIQPLKPDLSELKSRIENIDNKTEKGGEVKKVGTILVEDGVITEEVLEDALQTAKEEPPKKIGETLVKKGDASPRQVAQALRKQGHQIADASTIRVDVRKLDDLINMIGELVITQAMIKQNPSITETTDRKLIGDISQLASITSELQRTSTSLRMIPIKQTFQRMSRLVRDLTKNAGKIVAVEMEGEDTEIDRNMIDEIYNPLVHMIRNSVDHGIETPEARVKDGKPEKGLIQLKAYHKGGNIVIEISDDGKGLNKDKLVQKALDKGLIKSSDGLSEHEAYRLIFLPGFSTAEKVTDVSGRGVGMDVVKQAVEKLRGKTEVISSEGKGTTFISYFPLTMAIIDGMIVKVGHEKYIIPATAIRQLLRPARESYNNVVGKGEMVNVMGNLLPLLRLHDVFEIEPESVNPWEALVVVVEAENRSKCLLVDQVIGKEEVVIKSLGDGLKTINGVSGGAILGDGNVGLILDPEGLFQLSEQ